MAIDTPTPSGNVNAISPATKPVFWLAYDRDPTRISIFFLFPWRHRDKRYSPRAIWSADITASHDNVSTPGIVIRA
ncbi:MAG TPA: hypothetical protein VN809_08080, partial [Telmatospirillum sp.]|nr:hypothetical protein [Telmatospirillum sp.]